MLFYLSNIIINSFDSIKRKSDWLDVYNSNDDTYVEKLSEYRWCNLPEDIRNQFPIGFVKYFNLDTLDYLNNMYNVPIEDEFFEDYKKVKESIVEKSRAEGKVSSYFDIFIAFSKEFEALRGEFNKENISSEEKFAGKKFSISYLLSLLKNFIAFNWRFGYKFLYKKGYNGFYEGYRDIQKTFFNIKRKEISGYINIKNSSGKIVKIRFYK